MSKHWLEAADRIGHALSTSAVRHGGRCAWIGRSIKEVTTTGAIRAVVEGLGPELYDGTAGIALFLGQLHAATGDQKTRTIACEAIGHAITESHRAHSAFGLHSGFGGIAFAAAHLALLLDEPALASRAQALMDEHFENTPLDNGAPPDLLGGMAGTAVAFLAWPEALRRESDLEMAVKLGAAVADAAFCQDDRWAWPQAKSDAPPLTGLSHGAAGMGVVLLELHRRTGVDRFREVGSGAFAYENRCFDITAKNWPDFRPDVETPERAFGHGWCHGAPGIALARRHALSLQAVPAWQRDWDIALETCRRAAREIFEPGADVTLCHGLAGCVEPLLEAGCREELASIWEPFLEHGAWPSGLPSRGPNPSLMLGTAGVGYTFLRMHDPKTPSVLLPLLDR